MKYWTVPLNTYDVGNFIYLKRQRSYLYFRNNLKPGELQGPLRGFALPFHWKTWIQASYARPVSLWKVGMLRRRQQSCLHVAWMILSLKHIKHRKGVILGTAAYICQVWIVELFLGFFGFVFKFFWGFFLSVHLVVLSELWSSDCNPAFSHIEQAIAWAGNQCAKATATSLQCEHRKGAISKSLFPRTYSWAWYSPPKVRMR